MRKLLVLILCISMLFVTSCSLFEDDGSGHTFKMSLSSDPKNLDPQLADDVNSIAVAENLFSRLIRENSDGTLSPWASKDYEISDDNMTYTFYLNESFKWKAAGDFTAQVTAHDYVYAFRRLMDPANKSPYALEYLCIKNAFNVNSGSLPIEDLGVYAKDDYTVVFDLEFENANFLYLLSLLSASPCNEEFFNSCRGKYGLEADCIASNGPFYVRYWMHEQYSNDNYVRLTRNSHYSDISRVYPSGITYLINKKSDVKLKNFTSEATDILVLNDFTELQNADEYTMKESGYMTFGLVFNENNKLFSSKDIREVFSMSIDREELYGKSGNILNKAYSLFPSGANIVGSSLEYDTPALFDYNKSMAEYRWNFLLTQDEKEDIYSMTIIVPDTFAEYDSMRVISDNWYKLFGIHFGIEVLNPDDYAKRIENGSYDCALVPLVSNGGNPTDFIMPFGTDNTYGVSIEEVDSAAELYGKSKSLTEFIYSCLQVQKILLENYHFIPLWELPVRCYYDEDNTDIVIKPFTNAVILENAKHY